MMLFWGIERDGRRERGGRRRNREIEIEKFYFLLLLLFLLVGG